ncbi:MAG: amidohydrolase family protein [Ignavibacteriales bacterium]|nr:amidohydrolase family protein [Ignavibacteriales bacterium]
MKTEIRSQRFVEHISKMVCHCEGAKRPKQSLRIKTKTRLLRQRTARNDADLGFLRWLSVRMLVTVFLFIVHCPLLIASEPIPAKKQEKPIVLVGGTIHTVSGAVIEKGMLLFENGKITKIGTTIDVPQNTERIDVTGKHVYPGLINAASQVGLNEIEAARPTLDYTETGRINPNVRTDIAVNPESELIPTTRANGVTLSHVIPSGSLIAGRTSVIMMDGWTNEEMTLKTPAGLYVTWPNMNISRSSSGRQSEEEQRKNIEKNLTELRNAFADARAYLKAKKADPTKHLTDLRWESMAPLFDRSIPLIVSANDIQQLQSAVQFAKDENLRFIIHGGRDSWKIAELLKENNVGVIIERVHVLPARRWDEYDTPFTLAVKLHQAGILFAVSDAISGPMNERNLGFQAATAAAYGLPKEEALKSVTLNAAKLLGIESHVGSLDIGKDATLIVTTGDPLEIMSNVEMEFIQGKKVDLRSRHTQLWKKYEEKYRQLGIVK